VSAREDTAAEVVSPSRTSWTAWARYRITHTVPEGQWLPDRQPAYVASWIYVFGMATLVSLFIVIGSGVVLALGGSEWWHTSNVGHYVNSVHLWSVEIFFAVMAIHLWGKFWMAAWRGGRALTWMTGMVALLAAVGTGFTGYLSQTNFDSQWIGAQAKDGLNSVGLGAWFNALNPAAALTLHIVVLPLAVGVIVIMHIILVRRHGVVPPIGAEEPTS
jgi:hypothetical protein